jgi:hypothetical protein
VVAFNDHRSYTASVPEVYIAAADASAFDTNVYFAFFEVFGILDVLECRAGFCDPQLMLRVCIDTDVGF